MPKRDPVPTLGGDAYRAALRRLKMSMSKADERLGFPEGYTADAIAGRSCPKYGRRAKICLEFGVGMSLWDMTPETAKGVET